MNTVILSTYFPSDFKSLYWFTSGDYDFLTRERSFTKGDFIVIDLYHNYFSGVNILDDLHTFLNKLDKKGVKWLLYIPNNQLIQDLFSNYNIHSIPAQRYRHKIPALYISNYSA